MKWRTFLIILVLFSLCSAAYAYYGGGRSMLDFQGVIGAGPPAGVDTVLLETGEDILLETGDYLLLE